MSCEPVTGGNISRQPCPVCERHVGVLWWLDGKPVYCNTCQIRAIQWAARQAMKEEQAKESTDALSR